MTHSKYRYLNDGDAAPAKAPEAPADWKATLPEDIRGNSAIGKYTSAEHLARGYVALNGRLGDPDSYIQVPKAGDAAALSTTLRRLGAPEKVEGYKITLGDNLPADVVGPDKPLGKAFLQAAHANGLLPSQAQGVFASVAAVIAEAHKAEAAATEARHKENTAALQKEWGDAYKGHIALAEGAITKAATAGKFDPVAFKDKVDKAGLGTDPDFLKAFAFFGSLVGEPDAGPTGKGGGFGAGTPAEHEARALELQRKAINEPNAAERKRLNLEASKEWALASK